MAAAWYQFAAGIDRSVQETITAALREAGIEPVKHDAQNANCPGLLFFAEIDEELSRFVTEISRAGRERVLAIAVSGANLATNGIWKLALAGASDVLVWDPKRNSLKDVAARLARWDTIDRLLESPRVKEQLVGQSPAWIAALRRIVEVAGFAEASVLITGESGTGKELAAQLVHALDPRPKKREFVVVDCTTIVRELSGSELFGHERGAFTGAVSARDGAFAMANGGTLFLDEVGELQPDLQAQLLRVVQERTYKPVGGNTWRKTDFRLVSATNRDLTKEVEDGQFRRDLYYRLASWIIRLPPLEDRKEDILPLAQHFLNEFQPGEGPMELDDSVRDYLVGRDYPGNVRDLRQLCARISQLHVGRGPITIGSVPVEERTAAFAEGGDWSRGPFEDAIHRAIESGAGLEDIGRIATDTAVQIAIRNSNDSLPRAAMKLKVSARALQMRRKKALGFNGSGPAESTGRAEVDD